jgi:CHAT domain-containing protein
MGLLKTRTENEAKAHHLASFKATLIYRIILSNQVVIAVPDARQRKIKRRSNHA